MVFKDAKILAWQAGLVGLEFPSLLHTQSSGQCPLRKRPLGFRASSRTNVLWFEGLFKSFLLIVQL